MWARMGLGAGGHVRDPRPAGAWLTGKRKPAEAGQEQPNGREEGEEERAAGMQYLSWDLGET